METYPFSSVGMLQQLWCLPQYEYRYEWAPLHREDIFLKKNKNKKKLGKVYYFVVNAMLNLWSLLSIQPSYLKCLSTKQRNFISPVTEY